MLWAEWPILGGRCHGLNSVSSLARSQQLTLTFCSISADWKKASSLELAESSLQISTHPFIPVLPNIYERVTLAHQQSTLLWKVGGCDTVARVGGGAMETGINWRKSCPAAFLHLSIRRRRSAINRRPAEQFSPDRTCRTKIGIFWGTCDCSVLETWSQTCFNTAQNLMLNTARAVYF